MAKKSSVEKNIKRKKLSEKFFSLRLSLKKKIYDKSLDLEERFLLIKELSQLPKNSSRTRYRNRCELTGRPRGFYRQFTLSRSMIRDLFGNGLIPGLRKASW